MSDNKAFEDSMTDAMERIIADTTRNMHTACYVVEEEARKNCPRDMGVLRASITSDVVVEESEIVGIIGSNMEYAPYVHEGTGIYAKDGNGRKTPWGYTALAGKYKGFHWTWGQHPNPFLENAKLTKREYIERILGGKHGE